MLLWIDKYYKLKIPVFRNGVDNLNLGRIIILDSILHVNIDTDGLLTDGGGQEGDGNCCKDVGTHDDVLAVVDVVKVRFYKTDEIKYIGTYL